MNRYDLPSLVLVFTRHVLGEISSADSVVRPRERLVIERVCPTERLMADGFTNSLGEPTALFDDVRREALIRLPSELSEPEKLNIVTQLLELCIVDGELDRTESSLVVVAAGLLGLPSGVLDRHLDALPDYVGSVELDEPID
jgi:uncharacterized tellurite resistance protein B-like protein